MRSLESLPRQPKHIVSSPILRFLIAPDSRTLHLIAHVFACMCVFLSVCVCVRVCMCVCVYVCVCLLDLSVWGSVCCGSVNVSMLHWKKEIKNYYYVERNVRDKYHRKVNVWENQWSAMFSDIHWDRTQSMEMLIRLRLHTLYTLANKCVSYEAMPNPLGWGKWTC